MGAAKQVLQSQADKSEAQLHMRTSHLHPLLCIGPHSLLCAGRL